jgi:hypothetical protein
MATVVVAELYGFPLVGHLFTSKETCGQVDCQGQHTDF